MSQELKHDAVISLDIETFSDVDLRKSGVYAYAASPNFEILLLSYAIDDGPIVTLEGAETIRKDAHVRNWLSSHVFLKSAYNAQFERVCLEAFFGERFPADQWQCTMAWALYQGFPAGLDRTAKAMRLKAQKGAGSALIRYFSIPCKPTKTNGGRTRNLPEHDPERWADYVNYNRQDVEVEREIREFLSDRPMPEDEWRLWQLDQSINDRGVRVDRQLVDNAIRFNDRVTAHLLDEAKQITGLDNPKSVAQLKAWIEEEEGIEVETLNKKAVPELLQRVEGETTERVLELRRQLSKSSVAKYEAISRSVLNDDRVHGLFQYYGARTGRWCLTGDHEVLTPEGWIRLDHWLGGSIAVWNVHEQLSFQTAKALSFEFEGELLHYKSQRIDQISTLDHAMPVWGEKGWERRTVAEMQRRGRCKIAFTGKRSGGESLNTDELRVLIMTQADGHFTEGTLRFRFKKIRKIERCKMLLRRVEVRFIQASNGDESETITVRKRDLPMWLRVFEDKTFGWWLLNESSDTVFDELEHWDAYRCGPNSIQYSTINLQNAEIIQACAVLSGRTATLLEKKRENESWKTAYIVNIWLTPGADHELRKRPVSVQHKGRIYCAETSTGYFLVRRNGVAWITGNSGRLVQVQNLPRNSMPDLDEARALLRQGEFDVLELLYDRPLDVLSQLLRTAFIPRGDRVFAVADYSAIEARVIAWLAGEKWRQEVFASHGKIYEASASRMFSVPIEEITRDNPLRQKGKIAELALGYGGSVGALKQMGALEMGLDEDELQGLVSDWRKANPAIVKFWYALESAAFSAVVYKQPVTLPHGIRFFVKSQTLYIKLPSGRCLAYVRPRAVKNRFGNDSIGYESATPGAAIEETYGGKLAENITQAVARDCLALGMYRLAEAGHRVQMHIHDEVVVECPEESAEHELKNIINILGRPIKWACGLQLIADGFITNYYRKD